MTTQKQSSPLRRLLGNERKFLSLPSANVAVCARIAGHLDPQALRLALDRMQRVHPLLGARVVFDDDRVAWFVRDGRLTALDATLPSDGGWSLDLPEPVLARALCHIDNAYWIPAVRVNGDV